VNASRIAAWLLGAILSVIGVQCGRADEPAPVVHGTVLQFPRDFGVHPAFGVEWWYITGWLTTDDRQQIGFQITFFRSRVNSTDSGADANPSAFTARQLLIAHCAISDPAKGRLWQDQRVRRAGMRLAEAEADTTRVWIDDWRLERHDDTYQTQIAAADFALQLSMSTTQPVMLNGDQGFSQKGPAPQSASFYYSEPQLRVAGQIERDGRPATVHGIAWLDHEWSSQYLDPSADGWDWVGLNLDDGGALMTFRIRDHDGRTYWTAGTWRDAQGHVRALTGQQILWSPRRYWRSTRSGVRYPVGWQLQIDQQRLDLEPLMDDQENDTRLSTGAIYWEGAVRVREQSREIGRGYLELTGYDHPLVMR
jgi:predicted secreted hydrolase